MDFSIRIAIESILDQLEHRNQGGAKNVIVSPASLDITLRTVTCGAKGETLKQLLRFLGAEDIHDLNSKASSTMEVLRLASPEKNPPPPVPTKKRKRSKKAEDNVPAKVSCANAIWVDEQYSVKDSFKKLLTEVYQVEASNANFLNKHSGLITSKKCSNREDFHLIEGINKVSVPFMHEGHTWFRYRKFDEFKVLELPYKIGGKDGPCFSMYIFLPHKVDGLSEMMNKFGGSNPRKALSQTLGRLERVKMRKVMIPEWKSSNKLKLKDTMQKLGLKLPFKKDRRDFTEMLHGYKGKEEVYISEVIQSAYIDVDKNGTEATAAVSAIMNVVHARSRAPVIHKEEFVADHPFMFMIVERDSETVIFMGAVFNPLDHH
ncbi:At1g47710 [Linum perenne]